MAAAGSFDTKQARFGYAIPLLLFAEGTAVEHWQLQCSL